MYKMKQVLKITGHSFSNWRKSPRVWMTFILAFVLCIMLSDQLISFAAKYESNMQILEPFIWTFGDVNSIMLSSLLLVLLFGDIPFIGEDTPYWLMRTQKSIWLMGKLLYMILATVIYNIFLLVTEGATASKYSFMGNVWSETAAMIGFSGGGERVRIPISVKTMESTMPYKCAATVFFLMLLYSMTVAVIMMYLSLIGKTAVGIIGVFVINLFGYLLNPSIFQELFHLTERQQYKANLWVGWLSPLNHATYSMHNFGYDYLPSISVSVLIFLILIVFFTFLSYRQIKKYNFNFTQVEN